MVLHKQDMLGMIVLGSYPQGGGMVPTMPGGVFPRVKDIGPFSASME